VSHSRRDFLASALFGAPALWASFAPRPALAQELPTATVQNVFISPCGKPFRAAPEAPYPVADWFRQADRNGDGKLDHAEFTADAEAFFALLDRNRDGYISPYELSYYEAKIAPEVLGGRYNPTSDAAENRRNLLWKVQMGGGGPHPSGDVEPPMPKFPQGPNEAANGASPFSFFNEPEPVAAADLHFRGMIPKADFIALSDIHFAALDSDKLGYLTLASLPRTPMQKLLARGRRRRA
jgi:hypothetical protein